MQTNETTSNIQQSQESTIKKKVVIALPGDNFSSNFLVNWSNTLISLWTSEKYDFAIAPATGSYIPHVRMQTLGLDVKRGIDQKPFKGDDFDIWLTIDSDIIFSTEHVLEILASVEKHPVVGAMYRMRDLTHIATVKTWDQEHFIKNGQFEFLTPEFVETWKKETGLRYMPVNYTGLGFFACRREVIDKMQYPYFDGELKEIHGENGVVMRDMSSEDVNFCHNITKAGFEIVLDSNIRVGHLKPVVI
jgi:hypothetical protein